MSLPDEFSSYVAGLLDGRYDCVDRIVLNGYFLMGQTSGGLLTWWNELWPGAPLDQKRLEQMAGDFSRRLHAFAKKHQIPVIYCPLGDKTKHQRAEKLRPQDPAFQGVFAILVARAPALVWKAKRNRQGKLILRRQTPWPLVQHYHFHILDPHWGVLEHPAYDLTVFKLVFGKLVLKMYDKGGRLLRIEAVVNNVDELRCGKRLEKLPPMLEQLERMVVNFLAAVQAAHLSYLDSGALDRLPTPSVRGTQRLAGVDLQKPRMQAVAQAVVACAPSPGGFTAAQLAERVHEQQGPAMSDYDARRAAYDLRKLRGKQVVQRVERTRRYRVQPAGVRVLAGLLILREKVIKPVLAGVAHPRRGRPPKTVAPLDLQYQNLQKQMLATLRTLKLAA